MNSIRLSFPTMKTYIRSRMHRITCKLKSQSLSTTTFSSEPKNHWYSSICIVNLAEMRFQLVATFAALALSPFITAAALNLALVEREIWSYNDVYQHAVKRGGADHPVAEVIARHVLASLNSFLDMSTKLGIAGINVMKTTSNSGTQRCLSITPLSNAAKSRGARCGPGPFQIMEGVRVAWYFIGLTSTRMHVLSLWIME
jgi:hypothetical protein